MSNNWKKYFEETKDKPPRSLLVRALPFVKENNAALDLGAGALNDSKYLLTQGFRHVLAIDKEPVAAAIATQLSKERFTYTISDFEKYTFPKNYYDLINAQYSLPFMASNVFESVFQDIIGALKEGGIFVGQLFGDSDEWEDNGNMNFHRLDEAKAFLSKLTVLYFEEEEKEKPTAVGKMKHWHVFHFIAKK